MCLSADSKGYSNYLDAEGSPAPPGGTSPEDAGPSGQSPRRDTRSTHLLVLAGCSDLAVLANMLVHPHITRASSLGTGRNN